MNNFETKVIELRRIGDLITEAITGLENVLGTGTSKVTIRNLRVNRATPGTGKKRHLTAAAKQKIAQAMKARWAARKANLATGKKPVLVGRTKKAA